MPVCTCEACRYSFAASWPVERCPDCGAEDVRLATVPEILDYVRIRREIMLEDQLRSAS